MTHLHLQNWLASRCIGTTARDYGIIREMLETYSIADIEYIMSWGEELRRDVYALEYEGTEWEYDEILSNIDELDTLAFTSEMRELATRW